MDNNNYYAAPQSEVLSQPSSENYTLASPWIRLGAHFVESLIGGLCIGPFYVLLIISFVMAQNQEPNLVLLGISGIGLLIAFLIYFIITVRLITKRGQTIGKAIVKIKIVRHETAERAGFWRIFGLRGIVNGLIGNFVGFLPFIGPLIQIAYIITDHCFIFREDRQCIHDKIADTMVINC